MVNFKNNVTVVIATLKRYRYGPRAIQISMGCYNALNESMALNGIQWFSMDYALEWCEHSAAKYLKPQYRNAIYRLYDVYEYGRILGSHLVVYAHPSKHFQDRIEEYLSDISLTGDYTQAHLTNIRHKVVQFCCFIQYNGAGCIEDIDYSMLDGYDRFLRESSKAYYINEGLVSGFLEYMSAKGRCPRGYFLYLHYIETDKCTSLSDLESDAQAVIHVRRKAGACPTAEEFYQSINDFTQRLKSAGYSKTVTDSSPYHLTLLYLFLDRENLGYDRIITHVWFEAVGKRLFGKGFCMARRTYEMYDDYVRMGDILPSHWWKHTDTEYDRLPSWCRAGIAPFIAAKEKEGWKENTIKMYRTCCTRFCGFLVSSGVTSFAELSPGIIKEFNLFDNGHKTPEAKNAYNSRIRKFLIYLEMKEAISMGMHLALPGQAAGGEKIVEILSPEDIETVEVYCANAATPLELRDAAILMVALNMGFRSSDIIGMKISDIDWKNRSIRIFQQKTWAEHLYPMDIKTGNAIYRYLKDARRRDTGSDRLFLNLKAPYSPAGRSACRNAMERAGVSTGKVHMFRRTFGSATLNSGATLAETAKMLGHSDTKNVHKYTSLDTEKMRICPLSLSGTGLSMEGRYGHE